MNKIYNNVITFTDNRDSISVKNMELIVTQDKIIQPTHFFEKDAMLSILARELSPLANKYQYTRLCPYKFEEKNDGIYIQFAEKRPHGTSYQIKEKKILKFSNNNNLKVYESFLYDVVDYLVYIGYVTKIGNGYFTNVVNAGHVPYEKFPVVDDDYLIKNNFIFI